MERKTFFKLASLDEDCAFDDDTVLRVLIRNFALTVVDNPTWQFDPRGPMIQFGEDEDLGRYALWAADAIEIGQGFNNVNELLRDHLVADLEAMYGVS